MTDFSLDWNGSAYGHEAPIATVINHAIRGFCEENYDYIILTPTPPIQHCSYLQTCSPDKGDDGLMRVEIRFDYPDSSFKLFAYETNDKDKICLIFMNYWPSLTDW